MPHLTLEYTDNLPQLNTCHALLALNNVLVASGQFDEIDIKSRAIKLDTFLVGVEPEGRAFVHVKLAIMNGRSPQTKRELSENLLLALQQVGELPANTHVQFCVEVQEIEREFYSKIYPVS